MVALGRALLANPRLLLCDEISLGLAPKSSTISTRWFPTSNSAASAFSRRAGHRAFARRSRPFLLPPGRQGYARRPPGRPAATSSCSIISACEAMIARLDQSNHPGRPARRALCDVRHRPLAVRRRDALRQHRPWRFHRLGCSFCFCRDHSVAASTPLVATLIVLPVAFAAAGCCSACCCSALSATTCLLAVPRDLRASRSSCRTVFCRVRRRHAHFVGR